MSDTCTACAVFVLPFFALTACVLAWVGARVLPDRLPSNWAQCPFLRRRVVVRWHGSREGWEAMWARMWQALARRVSTLPRVAAAEFDRALAMDGSTTSSSTSTGSAHDTTTCDASDDDSSDDDDCGAPLCPVVQQRLVPIVPGARSTTYHFCVPKRVHLLVVSGAGGGGAGGRQQSTTFDVAVLLDGTGGLSGQTIVDRPVRVCPRESVTLTIGGGGRPVASHASVAVIEDGADTVIETLEETILLRGGASGKTRGPGHGTAGESNVFGVGGHALMPSPRKADPDGRWGSGGAGETSVTPTGAGGAGFLLLRFASTPSGKR